MLTRVLAVMAAAIMLAACGGGGGGPTVSEDVTMMPPPPPPPVPEPDPDPPPPPPTVSAEAATQSLTGTAARRSAERIASSLPAFGSVSQSATRDGATGVSTDRVSTSFDGTTLQIAVDRPRGNDIDLNTDEDVAYAFLYDRSPVPGHDRAGDGYILDYKTSETTLAYAAVSWLNSDPTDYLAGGYWLHATGDVAGSNFTIDAGGAFADGPEISLASRPSMPTLGSATYRGDAEGLYALEYGSELPAYRGQEELGVWGGDLRLTANFAARTIGGCIGCDVGMWVNGIYSDYRAQLGAVPFDARGTFRGSTVRLEHPQLAFTRNTGNWGGMFSNRLDATGDPRLVAGTVGGEATSTGGSNVVFVGAWYGTK